MRVICPPGIFSPSNQHMCFNPRAKNLRWLYFDQTQKHRKLSIMPRRYLKGCRLLVGRAFSRCPSELEYPKSFWAFVSLMPAHRGKTYCWLGNECDILLPNFPGFSIRPTFFESKLVCLGYCCTNRFRVFLVDRILTSDVVQVRF